MLKIGPNVQLNTSFVKIKNARVGRIGMFENSSFSKILHICLQTTSIYHVFNFLLRLILYIVSCVSSHLILILRTSVFKKYVYAFAR